MKAYNIPLNSTSFIFHNKKKKNRKSKTRNTIFWSKIQILSMPRQKNKNSEKTHQAQTKKPLPVRPPAPVTSTVLLGLSAMATTPNCLVTLFTASSFLFLAREKKPKEEEEREIARSLNEEEETGGSAQYLWH